MMIDEHTTYVGISVCSQTPHFTFAALDHENTLIALGSGEIADVIAYIGGLKNGLLGILAPSHLNLGIAKQEQILVELAKKQNKYLRINMRLAELELFIRGFHPATTPYELENCPLWMQSGFLLYEYLQEMAYLPFPDDSGQKQWMEVNAEVGYLSLNHAPLMTENTLEGRLQRQLILFENGVKIPDPMDFFEELTRHRLLNGVLPVEDIHSNAELDAMLAAYMVKVIARQPQDAVWVGNTAEGIIVIPPGKSQ